MLHARTDETPAQQTDIRFVTFTLKLLYDAKMLSTDATCSGI